MLPRNWNAPRCQNSLQKTSLELPCYRCWGSVILTLKKIEQKSFGTKGYRLSCCSGTNATAAWLGSANSPALRRDYANNQAGFPKTHRSR
jgi:hypothetical protein